MRLIMMLLAFGSIATYGQDYKLGPGDLVEIRVMDLDEINGDYRIDGSGYILVPYLDQLQVRDLSSQEVQELITDKLRANFLNDPKVLVEIKEYKSRPISVIGAVHRPGHIRDSYDVDLLQVLTEVGGLRENALNKALVIRMSPGGRGATLEIDLNQLLYEGKHYLNIPIFPGDTVNVPTDVPLSVYVSGEVSRAGELTFSRKNKVTILQVIAKSGGFTDYAKRRKVRVKREINGVIEEFKVDVKAIQSGKEDDFMIVENDIVIVP